MRSNPTNNHVSRKPPGAGAAWWPARRGPEGRDAAPARVATSVPRSARRAGRSLQPPLLLRHLGRHLDSTPLPPPAGRPRSGGSGAGSSSFREVGGQTPSAGGARLPLRPSFLGRPRPVPSSRLGLAAAVPSPETGPAAPCPTGPGAAIAPCRGAHRERRLPRSRAVPGREEGRT